MRNYINCLLLMVALLYSAQLKAYDFETDGIYYDITSSNTVEVTYRNNRYNSYQGNIAIPNTVVHGGETYTVTAIGDCAFYECAGLKEVYIPETVTKIGESAFYYCAGLVGELTLPEGVTSIGAYAFYNCTGLTRVNIPSSVTSVGSSAFCYCTGLKDLSLPEGVTSIGSFAFYNCSGLVGSLTLPDSMTAVGESAFCYCSGLAGELVIPNSMTTVESYGFEYCTGFTSLSLPASLTTINSYAFYGCGGLGSIFSYSQEPPTCKTRAFYGVPTSTCVLYVPQGTREAYATATLWMDFENIVEM